MCQIFANTTDARNTLKIIEFMLELDALHGLADVAVYNVWLMRCLQPTELIDLTEYLLADFTECIADLYRVYEKSRSLQYQAVRNKYKRTE